MKYKETKLDKRMRCITIDVEVSPEFVSTYGKHHEAQVLGIELYQYMFCFAYKEPGKKTVVVSLPDFPLYKKDPRNDRDLVRELHRVLSNYNYIIAHNKKFDLGVAMSRFIRHGLSPIVPPKGFCTLTWARRNLHLNSYSLKNVAHFFGITEKMETSKGLWQRIHYNQDPKAWKEMKLYNSIDVKVTDQLHEIMAKWDTKPEPILIEALCQNPRCGSDDIEWRGWTQQRKPKRRFECHSCGKWGQSS